MARSRWLVLAAGCALFATHCTSVAHAADHDETVQRDVERLLDAGWRKGAKIAEVEKLYEAASATAPGDVRISYAMALVAIKLNRYPRALALLDEATGLRPKVLPARRARIWTLMVLQHYQKALDEINVTSQLLVEHDYKPEQVQDAARFLGRMLAWLAVQGNRDVAEGLRVEVERKITERFEATALRALEEGRSAMTRELNEQQLSLDLHQIDAKAAQTKLQNQRKQDLQSEKDAVEGDLEALAARGPELQEQRDELLDKLRSELAPLDRQFEALSNEAQGVSATIARLQAQIGLLQIDFETAPSEFDAARIAGLIDSLSMQIIPLRERYRRLDREATQVNIQRGRINQQAHQVQSQFAAELRAIERQAAADRARLKRIAVDRADANKPVTGNTAGVRSQTAQAQAFTSYQPFPLEEEKRLLLESLR